MAQSYVSMLTSDDYLKGLLVLFYSVKATATVRDFHVLVTSEVSSYVQSVLRDHGIPCTRVQTVANPSDIDRAHRWFPTYSKLHVFGLDEYDKIVYLDADTLVLESIDDLFAWPHMSGANAGGKLVENSHWVNLNTGVFVVTPSISLRNDMLSRIGRIETTTSGGTAQKPRFGSDQDFVNAYYSDWPQRGDLHLDHRYNMLHYHLDAYHNRFGYTLTPGPNRVAVIHYASYLKPWMLSRNALCRLQSARDLTLEESALQLWIDAYATL
jgi:lipopolysaccharide biosynthesis glycosyltransferase